MRWILVAATAAGLSGAAAWWSAGAPPASPASGPRAAEKGPPKKPPEDGADWPCLYGPNHDAVSPEKSANLAWPANGPPVLWEKPTGAGYSQPVIVKGRLYLFDREADSERLVCRDAETGAEVWKVEYPTHYEDRYGYSNGPRCTPIIDGDRIYTLGAEGKLHCYRTDGSEVWSRDLNADYRVEQGFFGVGATPLLEGDRLIINVGGKKTHAGIAAISTADGKTLWTATSDGASYATPRAATIHGKRHVFVFTEAGLVDVDPANGAVRWSIPFRSKLVESVNATSPLVAGDVVMVSATYRTGALAVRIKPDGGYEELWRNPRFLDSHFSNLIHVDGRIYGFAGRHEPDAELFCCELKTGAVLWRLPTNLGRGQILRVGDRFLLWSERGRLLAGELSAEKWTGISDFAGPGGRGLFPWPTWTPPALSRGRLYLRNETTLLCLDLRPN